MKRDDAAWTAWRARRGREAREQDARDGWIEPTEEDHRAALLTGAELPAPAEPERWECWTCSEVQACPHNECIGRPCKDGIRTEPLSVSAASRHGYLSLDNHRNAGHDVRRAEVR